MTRRNERPPGIRQLRERQATQSPEMAMEGQRIEGRAAHARIMACPETSCQEPNPWGERSSMRAVGPGTPRDEAGMRVSDRVRAGRLASAGMRKGCCIEPYREPPGAARAARKTKPAAGITADCGSISSRRPSFFLTSGSRSPSRGLDYPLPWPSRAVGPPALIRKPQRHGDRPAGDGNLYRSPWHHDRSPLASRKTPIARGAARKGGAGTGPLATRHALPRPAQPAHSRAAGPGASPRARRDGLGPSGRFVRTGKPDPSGLNGASVSTRGSGCLVVFFYAAQFISIYVFDKIRKS